MRSQMPDLGELIALFYERPDDLGRFEAVEAEDMPAAYRQLLAHDRHMTVTVEQYHHSPVDVRVLAESTAPPHYSRKILLARQSDGAVVQFGIMRIDLRFVGDAAREEILARAKPLGRILIEHQVLREVELVGLWRVEPSEELKRHFGGACGGVSGGAIYGRTALIYCHDEPAVELLEIVVA